MIVQAGPTATLVFASGAPTAFVDACLEVVTTSDSLDSFLAAVTALGWRAVPDFVLVTREATGIRLLARGEFDVVVTSPAGAQPLPLASGVSTWSEHRIDDASVVVIRDRDNECRVAFEGRRQVDVDPQRSSMPQGEAAVAAPPLAGPAAEPGETIVGYDLPVELAPGPVPMATPSAERAVLDDGPAVTPAPDMGNLFETRFKGVEAAAVRDEPDVVASAAALVEGLTALDPPKEISPPVVVIDEQPPAAAPSSPSPLIMGVPGRSTRVAEELGEHDGLTVNGESLAALRRSLAGGAGPGAARTPAPTGGVQAVRCRLGHPNAPAAPRCRSCGGEIADRMIYIEPRPTVGRLVFDGGMVVAVDRRLLLGRKPSTAAGAPVADLPSLVTVPDPETLLSRTHAEVRVEGWNLSLVDLKSQNGTFVVPPGQTQATRLRPMEPYPVSSGMRILFADVTACTFEAGQG